MPGTEPSGSRRPASSAMPVTVPIVSKKSLSMIAKIVSTAEIEAELGEHVAEVEVAEGGNDGRDGQVGRGPWSRPR